MHDKSIVIVDFLFAYEHLEVEGTAALFFGGNEAIPMSDEEILSEVKMQYGYDAFQILHKQRAKA